MMKILAFKPSAVKALDAIERKNLLEYQTRQCYIKLPRGCHEYNKNILQSLGNVHLDINHENYNNVALWKLLKVHTYGPGNSFGDLALQHKCLRAARVVSATDCHMASISREDYNNCLIKIKEIDL